LSLTLSNISGCYEKGIDKVKRQSAKFLNCRFQAAVSLAFLAVKHSGHTNRMFLFTVQCRIQTGLPQRKQIWFVERWQLEQEKGLLWKKDRKSRSSLAEKMSNGVR